MKNRWIIIILTLAVLISISFVSAESNESIASQQLIDKADICISEAASLNIPISRANSSLEDAKQIHSAQLALEAQKRKSNYRLANEAARNVCNVTALSIRADEELKVFLNAYYDAKKSVNLSEMDELFQNINKSFIEERFEETLELVNQGHTSISEIQSKQTAIRLFYDVTTRTVKRFLLENWKKIVIITAIILILLLLFWRTLNRFLIKARIRKLQAQKISLNLLIKELQKQYFGTGKISEAEFTIKLNRYKEMMLDIERQIPLLEEDLAKLGEKHYLQSIFGAKKSRVEKKTVYFPTVREVKNEQNPLPKKNKKGHTHR